MRIVCPDHGIPDCSPLLNGCSRVIKMHQAATPAEVLCVKRHRLPSREIPCAQCVADTIPGSKQ